MPGPVLVTPPMHAIPLQCTPYYVIGNSHPRLVNLHANFLRPPLIRGHSCRGVSDLDISVRWLQFHLFEVSVPLLLQQRSSIGGPGPHLACRPPVCGPQTVIPSLCVLVGSARVHRDLSPSKRYTDCWVTHCCERNF